MIFGLSYFTVGLYAWIYSIIVVVITSFRKQGRLFPTLEQTLEDATPEQAASLKKIADEIGWGTYSIGIFGIALVVSFIMNLLVWPVTVCMSTASLIWPGWFIDLKKSLDKNQ